MSSQRIFVTGGTGFVGGHVIPRLLQSGHSIAALKRSPAIRPQWESNDRFQWIDMRHWESGFESYQPDLVINLATAYGKAESTLEGFETNVLLPLHILDKAVSVGCRRFVQADTFFAKPEFAYGHMPTYIEAKRHFIWWAQEMVRGTRTNLISMRLEHVYGPGDRMDKFVPYLMSQLTSDVDIDLTAGEQLRDFIHVDDVAEAFAVVANADNKSAGEFMEYEVGTGVAYNVRHFVECAKNITHSSSLLRFGVLPYRSNEIMHSVANVGRICGLGWSPRVSLEEGIRSVVQAHGQPTK